MKYERAFEILKNKEICDVFYEKQPVWIQELQNNTAKIGFLNGSSDQSVKIQDLYEENETLK